MSARYAAHTGAEAASQCLSSTTVSERWKVQHGVQVREAQSGDDGGDVAPIPVTVRQLEALVRISESLARMELSPAVGEAHVAAAIALFHASTLDAVRAGMSQAVNLSEEQVGSPETAPVTCCSCLHLFCRLFVVCGEGRADPAQRGRQQTLCNACSAHQRL